MTREEALKVIDLNIGKLSGSMQEAIKTILNEWPKAYEQGREAALKDSLKWHKVQEGVFFDTNRQFLLDTPEGKFYCDGNNVTRDGYILFVDELFTKLPKED